MAVRFTTDATSLRVRWTLTSPDLSLPHMPATGVSGVGLYGLDSDGKWRFVDNGEPTAVSNESSFYTPHREQLLLYLPLYNGVKSIEIAVPKDKTITAAPLKKKPIAFYGTSITQGACASRPGMAFTNIVGRRLDVPIINLGFSGNGLMDPELADLMAELDPTIYVLDAIANMSVEMVEQRVEPFVKRLREAHPTTPIVLADRPSFLNISPTDSGEALRKVYDRLVEQKIPNLHFLPSLGMLGDDSEGTVDRSHPNDLGMMRQAGVFMNFLQPLLDEQTP